MKNNWFISWRGRIAVGILGVLVLASLPLGRRVYQMAFMARDFESQIRYMIENGGTIGAVPAEMAFSDLYLEAMFGENPELLAQLRVVIRRGLEDDPDLNLGEVAAMVVTHREDDEGNVKDVVAHIVGGFPLGRLAPQFHRDGFFRHQIDENLWTMGNSVLRFAGRDMVMFADEAVADAQAQVIEGILDGDIIPLVNSLESPIFYTAVLPNPRRVVPNQLRHHVQAVLYRGALAPHAGRTEVVLLTASQRSANYTMRVASDLKRMAELALKTQFHGIERQTEWGPHIDPWWAYEMAQTSLRTEVEREENIVRMSTEFDRVMVNAILKSLERFGRDWRRMRLVQEEQIDPREVDRQMASRSPLHYWSDEHRWGPNWPIAPTPEELAAQAGEMEVRRAEARADRAELRASRTAVAAELSADRAQQAEDQLAAMEEPTPIAEEMAELARVLANEAQATAQEAAREAEAARAAANQARADFAAAQEALQQVTEERREQLRR